MSNNWEVATHCTTSEGKPLCIRLYNASSVITGDRIGSYRFIQGYLWGRCFSVSAPLFRGTTAVRSTT